MRVLTIVHEADAGPGVFSAPLAAASAGVDTWLAADEREPPSPAEGYDAIISLGGSAHPNQEQHHPWLANEKRVLRAALAAGVPLLGVCLGSELIAEVAGAQLLHLPRPEIGWYAVRLTEEGRDDPVVGPIGTGFEALEWHSYAADLPNGATPLAHSASCLQAYRVGTSAWGLQFHAEVTDADFQHWLDNYATDEDAVRAGVDPEQIAAETAPRMAAWHDLGVGVCERFLQTAASR